MRPPSWSRLRIAPAGGVGTAPCWRAGFGGCEAERAVRPMAVVVLSELAQHAVRVTPVGDQQPVEALPSDAANESLSDRVCLRRPDRRADHTDAVGGEYRVKSNLVAEHDDLKLLVLGRATAQQHERHRPPAHHIQERRQHRAPPHGVDRASDTTSSDSPRMPTPTHDRVYVPHTPPVRSVKVQYTPPVRSVKVQYTPPVRSVKVQYTLRTKC